MLAMLACSNDNVTGSSEDPNVLTAKTKSSSSFDEEMLSSSSVKQSSSSIESPVLCKVSGDWGDAGSCVRILPSGKGDLWSIGSKKVSTNTYAEDSSKYGNRAGEFFFEIDSVEGSKTWISWFNANGKLTDFGNGSISANFFLNKDESIVDPFVKIGFYIAGFDSNGVALSADISNWNGICVLYNGTVGPVLQLDLGDSLNQKMGYALPSIIMSTEGVPQCYEWNQFKQPDLDKEHKIISGEEAAKHVVSIFFLFQKTPSSSLNVYAAEFLAIGTNRDE